MEFLHAIPLGTIQVLSEACIRLLQTNILLHILQGVLLYGLCICSVIFLMSFLGRNLDKKQKITYCKLQERYISFIQNQLSTHESLSEEDIQRAYYKYFEDLPHSNPAFLPLAFHLLMQEETYLKESYNFETLKSALHIAAQPPRGYNALIANFKLRTCYRVSLLKNYVLNSKLMMDIRKWIPKHT